MDMTTLRTGAIRKNTFIHVLGAACVAALLGSTACATTPRDFNPDSLEAGSLSQVDGICQNVMGLKPDERMSYGYWHSDRLDYMTSKYRGCVTSLSDSLQDVVEQQALQQAGADCRNQGHAAGSPDLALCMLQSKDRLRTAAATTVSTALQTPAQAPAAEPGSFYKVSPNENHRRELTACAAIGLLPTDPAFQACVHDLDRTFFAIDNPIT